MAVVWERDGKAAHNASHWKHAEFAVPSWVPSVAGSQTVSVWLLGLA